MTVVRAAAVLLGVLLAGSPANAQTTGSINGTVTDHTGAVLPGVTVTATSPAQMGVQTAVTNPQGVYRFPSLVPGTYTVSYDLSGFSTVRRDGIIVNLGFTATVNVQLSLAALTETVTVSGASPVVDVTSTTSTFNVTSQMLESLPNARDIWSVMGQSPGVRVGQIDVGGSRAGTQTGFEAFGYSGQVRVQVDGVNTTEGTGAAGFYYDYGSFEEIQLGGDGMDAQSATPGVQLNAVIKSGSNKLRGTFYADYENENMQGTNLDARLEGLGIGRGTRTLSYRDLNGDIGGPIRTDKLWYFLSLRRQDSTVTVTGFPVENPGSFGQLTSLQNATYKLSYQLNRNNRFSHYIQYGRKLMPFRGGSSTRYRWTTFKQDSGSYAANVEWNSIVTPKFIFRGAVSTFGYNWPNLPYGPNGEFNDNLDHRITDDGSGTTFTKGSESADRQDRRRWQFNWDATTFHDGFFGDHAIKFGFLSERESNEFTDEGFLDEITLAFRTTAAGLAPFTTPYRVTLRNTPRDTYNANWHHGAYVHDNWQVSKRLMLSMGVRWDFYESFFPDQEIRPSRFRDFFYAGVPVQTSVGPYALARTTFADNGFKAPGVSGIRRHPDLFVARLGFSFDLGGDGKTVVKGNWGRFYHNTGNAGGTLNPLSSATATFDWLDLNGDRLFQLNELGQNRAVAGIGGSATRIDPNLKNPYTDAASVWFERELAQGVGLRAGYTYRSDGNSLQAVELARLYGLYSLARTFADPGIDGIVGNADDGPSITWWDIPGTAPASRTETRNIDAILATDKAVDLTVSKRMSNRWSLVTSFYYNWDRDRGRPQNPNQERFNDETLTNWNFKVFGTYQAPWNLMVTSSLRHQSGNQISRDLTVSGQSGQNITGTYELEPNTSYRTDNVSVLDAKVERRFRLRGRTVSAFADAFNILNTNVANVGSQTTTVGRPTVTLKDGSRVQVQGFLRPTAIVPPRIFRVGVRISL
ncbi:MAG: TonB-dependent receptor [Acidimicrobiia bacterium]|nr:TonB-dependent receptor [Acidimicrobiia bacterium]